MVAAMAAYAMSCVACRAVMFSPPAPHGTKGGKTMIIGVGLFDRLAIVDIARRRKSLSGKQEGAKNE
jgi:hypothetical protein